MKDIICVDKVNGVIIVNLDLTGKQDLVIETIKRYKNTFIWDNNDNYMTLCPTVDIMRGVEDTNALIVANAILEAFRADGWQEIEERRRTERIISIERNADRFKFLIYLKRN